MSPQDPIPQPAKPQILNARIVELLDCVAGRECDGRKRVTVVMTFGAADGVVDCVALTRDEGHRLLWMLAQHYKLNGALGDRVIFAKKFCASNSIGRAQLNLRQGAERMLEELHTDLPQIAEYVRTELAALERALRRCCRPRSSVDRIIERVRAAILVAVDAARIDT